MLSRIVFMMTFLAAAASICSAESIPATRIEAVENYLGRLEKLGFAGAVLVSQGADTWLARGFGMADREAGTSWSTNTISTIGSITKQFTGAAILALAEEGRLSLDDPIGKHFPSVPADKTAITVHDLLTHGSGIVDLQGLGDFDPISRDEFVRRAMTQELAFEPGTGYEYSNAGYSLLGMIVEKLTEETYEEYVRERFFLPAGMNDTGYVLAGFEAGRLAQGYRNGEKWGTVVERPMDDDGPYWALRANGGIHSTLEDMQRWAKYLLAGQALSPNSMQLYWSPHVDEGGGDSFYGYGWVVMDIEGHRVITHNGGNGIHFADMAIVPASELVIALQCNVIADFPVANQMLQQIGAHLLLGADLPRVPDRAHRTSGLEEYAGSFAFASGGEAVISVEKDELRVVATDPTAFAVLLSTRPVDRARAERLSSRIDAIVGAWLRGDMHPLYEAYERRATRERLSQSAARARQDWEAKFGSITGHHVLGTAMRDGRDVTLVRIECERGHVDRAYVWDPDEEERLLGVSRRGLDPVLHVYPETDGGFASWDGRSGASRSIQFVTGDDGSMEIVFGEAGASRATRTQ